MRITDIVVIVIMVGLFLTAATSLVVSFENNYENLDYSEDYQADQYADGIRTEAERAGVIIDNTTAEQSIQRGEVDTTRFDNIIFAGYNAFRRLLRFDREIENMRTELSEDVESAGIVIDPIFYQAFMAIVGIAILAALIAAVFRVRA